MPNTAEARKTELLDQIVREVRAAAGREADEAEWFTRRYYAPVAPKDVLSRELHHLAGAVLALWRFAEERQPGRIKVRVYNPTVEEHGYHTEHTVAEVVNDDMPFLVDSVTGELNRRGRTVHLVVHPLVPVHRDEEGRRIGMGADGESPVESLIHVELDQETDAQALAEIEHALAKVLSDVRMVVDDWRPMRQRIGDVVRHLGLGHPAVGWEYAEESQALLQWIEDNHFTFLGYREYRLAPGGSGEGAGEAGEPEVQVVPGSGLGILRGEDAETFPLSPETVQGTGRNPLLVISKAGRRATVHRTVHMDYVGVRRLDEEGRTIGGWSFVGLLTSGVYHSSAATIPFVRRKIQEVMSRAQLPSASHDAKALLHILETFPRDELFQMTEDELYETSLGILQLQDRQRLALFVREDRSKRFVSCLVYVPRDRYNTELRARMQEILAEAFQGEISAFYTQVADSPLARAHFIVRTRPGEIPEYDVHEIENRLAEAALSWSDRLQQMLVLTRGEEAGLRLHERYGEAFPVAYREQFDAAATLYDIDEIEAGYATASLRTSLYRPSDVSPDRMRFKIFHAGMLRPLSDVLPMLENMGLEVMFEVPYRVEPEGEEQEMWIRDLVLSTGDGAPIDIDAVRGKFQDTFARVWNGDVEDDSFNRLVLEAQLEWRQVVVLRAYARYLKQVGLAFSQSYMADTLAGNPEVARLLVRLFEVRFDPDLQVEELGAGGIHRAVSTWAERETRSREILASIRRALNAVERLDQDRILRRFRNLIESTLRTNYFQHGADGAAKPYVSFKLSSRVVQGLPKPRPLYEVFVYSPRTEAVHLRGGMVARGGIRWSDRPEDFRTEVLGLMKAQMVKNAVIVPVGAKGGFIVKNPPPSGGHEARLAEGVECYKTMIRGMLDLTDNLDGEQVVPPADVVRWDGDDTYLVVAADKGTATFSDLANSVSAEYGFWLRDAFASGGSAGYDHKKMGITARGAWESVKRHFCEMGRDVQAEPFTVVGIGDMGGDVFGNGMLLSKHTRLVAAFNHLHVFVDPNPDEAASWEERKRLFDLPRSTWADYDRTKISDGGGVFERAAKSIPLSPEVRALLGTERQSINPNELIKLLLKAPIDLLWFGGIGTFVKASEESHAVTGDRHNDDVRIDARDVHAKVIGEGANLGLTQRARVECGLNGVRLNTDFIDNSGGVDCSDHEVNIKISLNELTARGQMSLEERNQLLGSMTEEVAQLVLRDNYLQTQALSVAEAEGAQLLDRQAELIAELERAGRLDRALENLPSDEELERRRQSGRGLTRPELAVLLAYGKLSLYEELLASDLPDDALLLQDLFLYFPRPMRQRFKEELERHRLRREIIATFVTSSMINRVGPTFVTRLAGETGATATDIARAYTIVREAFELRTVWGEIEALDLKVPAAVQIALIHEVGRLVEWGTLWLLRKGTRRLDVTGAVADLKPAVTRLSNHLEQLLPEEDQRTLGERVRVFLDRGVPEELARRVVGLEYLGSAFDISRIARGREQGVEQVGRIFFHLGARFQLEWLRGRSLALAGDGVWEKAAVDGLIENFFAYQRDLAESVLEDAEGEDQELEALDRWLQERRGAVSRLDRHLAELKALSTTELPMLMVVDHQLRLLVES